MDRPQFLSTLVNWLRKGYPDGIPRGDYIPLVALLRRQLTDDEVESVAAQLVRDEPPVVTAADAGVEIMKVTDELPSDSDVDRVRTRLESHGWPFSPDFPAPEPGDDEGDLP